MINLEDFRAWILVRTGKEGNVYRAGGVDELLTILSHTAPVATSSTGRSPPLRPVPVPRTAITF